MPPAVMAPDLIAVTELACQLSSEPKPGRAGVQDDRAAVGAALDGRS